MPCDVHVRLLQHTNTVTRDDSTVSLHTNHDSQHTNHDSRLKSLPDNYEYDSLKMTVSHECMFLTPWQLPLLIQWGAGQVVRSRLS